MLPVLWIVSLLYGQDTFWMQSFLPVERCLRLRAWPTVMYWKVSNIFNKIFLSSLHWIPHQSKPLSSSNHQWSHCRRPPRRCHPDILYRYLKKKNITILTIKMVTSLESPEFLNLLKAQMWYQPLSRGLKNPLANTEPVKPAPSGLYPLRSVLQLYKV